MYTSFSVWLTGRSWPFCWRHVHRGRLRWRVRWAAGCQWDHEHRHRHAEYVMWRLMTKISEIFLYLCHTCTCCFFPFTSNVHTSNIVLFFVLLLVVQINALDASATRSLSYPNVEWTSADDNASKDVVRISAETLDQIATGSNSAPRPKHESVNVQSYKSTP